MERLTEVWMPPVVMDNFPPITLPDRSADGPFLLMTESAISTLEDENAQKLFSKFIKSRKFTFGVRAFKDFLLLKPEERKISQREFEGRLAGFFFSGIAYSILNRRLKIGDRLLSPQDTEEFYASLYPTKPKRNLYGLGLQMRGITIPDGILISEHEDRVVINGICEYSLMYPDNPRKILQLEHYRNIENVIADLAPTLQGPVREICFPGVIQSRFGLPANVEVDPGQFKVVFVFPNDDRKDLYGNIPGRVIFLPISRLQIRMVLTAVFMDTKNSLGSLT